MTTVLGAFTTQLYNLVNNMSTMFPDDPDIKFSVNAIFLMKKTNPRRLQTMFHNFIRPYEKEIVNRNEDFFCHNDFVKDHEKKSGILQ